VARAVAWRYSGSGQVELCSFKGNKLISCAAQPQAKK
jgi:hypothetical protein